MNVLILGGNSPRHHEWIRQLGAGLTDKGHAVTLHDYAHWTTGEEVANIDHEIEQLRITLDRLDNYTVIAKSIGTVIATLAAARGILRPSKCVFLGIPLDGVAGKTPEFAPSLTRLPETVVIQNEHDPYGNAHSIQHLLNAASLQQFSLITVPNNTTHDYTDIALIEEQLSR